MRTRSGCHRSAGASRSIVDISRSTPRSPAMWNIGCSRASSARARLVASWAPGELPEPVQPGEKKERGARLRALSHELEQRRWHTKLGHNDVVLVDRPGRGYGDDYSPFLVEAPVGELVRVRAEAVTKEGILAVAA